MKVERKEKAFAPITITIETNEELEVLYAATNHSDSTLREAMENIYELPPMTPRHREGLSSLWRSLDDIIDPK